MSARSACSRATSRPRGWAFCDGQLLAVSQNDALFSLLGTIYGGDGRTTFGLPDMRGRIPLHHGHGPGLSERRLGSRGGSEKVTLTVNQIPSHGHDFRAMQTPGTTSTPTGSVLSEQVTPIFTTETPVTNMAVDSLGQAGGNSSHMNLQPFICVNFIISLFGVYPSRN